jgi:hypothetical protein
MAATGVSLRHKGYDTYYDKWRRVRDVVSGQDAIYAGTTRYLAKLTDETDDDYRKRMHRTPFYNASWRTMAAFVGMMFRKPPLKEIPAALEPYLNDVTMSGVSFDNFAQEIVLEDIAVSRVGVLVDYPSGAQINSDGTPMSLAQTEALGLRPTMVMYRAEQILNWRFEYVNNRYLLTQVRLLETATETTSEFEEKEYDVIRVLDLIDGKYRVRRFKEDNEEQIGWDIFPTMNNAPMTEIPFFFIGPDGGQHELSEPVLIDLVDLNIKHYQVSSDYEHGCHMTGLPTPVVSGMTAERFDAAGNPVYPTLYIGSTSAWILPTGAEANYLEFTGQGLKALKENLDSKEAQMAALGARMLTPDKAGVEAAETVAMRHSGESSILAAIAVAVSEGLTKALKVFAQWAGVAVSEDSIVFEINRDFMPFAITPQALSSLLSAVQAGKLSHEAFFDLMKRGDLIDSELKFEEEQARIDAEPDIPAPVALVAPVEDDDEDKDEDEPKDKVDE